MKINLKMPVYIKALSAKERILYIAEGIILVTVLGYFFYRSVWGVIFLLPLIIPFLKMRYTNRERTRKWNLLIQFKEMINSVNASLQAGYSIENSFEVALTDMTDMYGRDAEIVKELLLIKRAIANNYSLESAIRGMAYRNDVEEIESFANLMATYKTTGGNITDIMRTYSIVIEEKVALKQEIETMICAKEYEQKIMNVIPFVILLYIGLTNKSFFDVLYHNMFGIITMTLVLIVYFTAVIWSRKIINNII